MSTKIQWCDQTWNPITGCTKIAAGCENCYAERQAKRLKAMGLPKYRNGFKLTCHPDELMSPILRKRNPQLIFVCSMGDLFHEAVPGDFIMRVWDRMLACSQHTFIILTKRPKRMRAWLNYGPYPPIYDCQLAPNVWLGVSVSTQAEANEWVPILMECPAAERIISFEPALERVDFTRWCCRSTPHIDWLICGCESGPGRRHFSEFWARDARDVCTQCGIPFFYKQGRDEKNKVVQRPRLDGRRWEEIPT